MKMRLEVISVVLFAMLAAPGRLAAQDADVRRTAPTVSVFAGIGDGPIEAATWGVGIRVPIWRPVAALAEYSGWGPGPGGTTCVAMPPESHRCSVSGRTGLVGLAVNLPVEGRLGVFAEAAGGRFSRDWLGDETVKSPALSLEAGARLQVGRGLSARVGGRFLRAHDDDYRALLGEPLQYSMGIVGLEYLFGRRRKEGNRSEWRPRAPSRS
jgi:hypothetical protein